MNTKNIPLRAFALFAFFAALVLPGEKALAQTKEQVPAGKTVVKPDAKTDLPKITQVDENSVKELFAVKKENAKPLLVNFWATWCVPCREEFPDLVKIDEEYRGKIDFITITLDDPAELRREVPQFLMEMKAKMPTYLLYTSKENEVIGAISKDWSGGLPFTVLYNEKREIVFTEQGIIKPPVLKAKINELLNASPETKISKTETADLLTLEREEFSFEKGIEAAKKDIADGIYKVKYYGLVPMMSQESTDKLKEKYGIEVIYHGCLVSSGQVEYGKGYNEISIAAIRNKFGKDVF